MADDDIPAARGSRPRPVRVLQPALHELLTAVRAPTVALSGRDGQIRESGAQGVFHADLRMLSAAVLTVDGAEPELVAAAPRSASRVWSTSLVRQAGDSGADPTIRVDREREVTDGGMTETLVVASDARHDERLRVRLRVAADLARIELVKSGRGTAPIAPSLQDGSGSDDGETSLAWAADEAVSRIVAPGAVLTAAAAGGLLDWDVVLPAHTTVSLGWTLTVTDTGGVVVGGGPDLLWSPLLVEADDPRLAQLLQQSLADLDALRMARATDHASEFFGAGAPWYFTLFGRDSIWAARLVLPLGTGPALGTLRALAALQGRRRDPRSGEAPGKIMHELRREAGVSSEAGRTGDTGPTGHQLQLPPVYYGTVDATPLWVLLLHDAWRAGLAKADVESLLDNAERALDWLAGNGDGDLNGDTDGDGFLEYEDTDGRGLSNQGWKDSEDAVRFADGSRARPSIALCEVQGYAVAAAVAGAELLEAFGRPGAPRWRAYAARLTGRFRRGFWVSDPDGDYPAIALDGEKKRVDTVTSNIGHLLGTGILDDVETAAVVRRLTAPDMDSGFGLRTMSSREHAYAPLSYHCGSVWAHDTAIVATGMSRSGHGAAAAPFVEGLLAAAAAFGGRLPELHSGDTRCSFASPAGEGVPIPVPYPAACRPQAWSAAAAVAMLTVVLGLVVDVPAGTVTLVPLRPSPVGALRVVGLAAGDRHFDVEIDAAGRVLPATATSITAAGMRLVTG